MSLHCRLSQHVFALPSVSSSLACGPDRRLCCIEALGDPEAPIRETALVVVKEMLRGQPAPFVVDASEAGEALIEATVSDVTGRSLLYIR